MADWESIEMQPKCCSDLHISVNEYNERVANDSILLIRTWVGLEECKWATLGDRGCLALFGG